MKTLPRLSLFALVFLASFLLFADSCIYALRPAEPEIGRPSACFTAVELALGLKSPSVVRYVELLAAWVLLLGMPVLWMRWKARARAAARARSATAPPGERCDANAGEGLGPSPPGSISRR